MEILVLGPGCKKCVMTCDTIKKLWSRLELK